jgi:predicted XRE-type DNA-binding protein
MKRKITVSTDDIFADLGLADSKEIRIRSDLLSEVVALIRSIGLPQKEVAAILGISAPKISALMTGKINDFSNDTLMNYLLLLGCNVEIKVLTPPASNTSIKKGIMQVKKTSVRRRRATSKV